MLCFNPLSYPCIHLWIFTIFTWKGEKFFLKSLCKFLKYNLAHGAHLKLTLYISSSGKISPITFLSAHDLISPKFNVILTIDFLTFNSTVIKSSMSVKISHMSEDHEVTIVWKRLHWSIVGPSGTHKGRLHSHSLAGESFPLKRSVKSLTCSNFIRGQTIWQSGPSKLCSPL